jgi:acyl-CoA reductase-like NAD-dependent aldehyde dehydrogenase
MKLPLATYQYGLASCVYTQDLEKARRVASRIQAGQVGINCYAIENMNVACPWVGHRVLDLVSTRVGRLSNFSPKEYHI